MNREINFQFVFQHPKTKEIVISAPYDIDKLLEVSLDEIHENTCQCDCVPTGESNVIECGLSCDYYQEFELIAKRQFTGLKDKNCKEIYEGDRIRYANSMEHGEGIIGFSAGFIIEWDLSTVKTEHPMIMQPLFYFQCSAEIEVIGNIHEQEDNNG